MTMRRRARMKWRDEVGNRFELVYKFWRVPLMRFAGPYWVGDGAGRGVLVKMTCWHGEVWYVRPEHRLAPA